MKELLIDIKTSILSMILFAVICCGVYPLAVYLVGHTLFRHQADGSLIVAKNGAVLGSELIGQQFSTDRYFNSRPSAAGTGYDAGSSGGTNLGPTSQKLHDSISVAVDAYRKENGLGAATLIPADAVTSSASGLDPDISVENADLQIARVARTRKLTVDQVAALVRRYTEGRDLGLFGEPRVNVLKLNLALDGRISSN
ncbi:MAG TPA: K(+)-transporting ATPase subunit C [Chthoniobacteraceae bacterium]|jgi:K+-transporting ATPase ATPase C chain|nr:K(+)-transporting ATPase subunit C [Chthoniobacteraceae bacterium]